MAYNSGPLIQFFGNLAGDPEEFGNSDSRPVNFRVAVNFRRYDSQESGYIDDVTFYRCTAFRYHAEQSMKLRKGDFVWVSGSLQPREYQTRENETRMSFDVVVHDMHAYLSLTSRDNDDRGRSGNGGGRRDDDRDRDRGGSNRQDDDRGRGSNRRDDDRGRGGSNRGNRSGGNGGNRRDDDRAPSSYPQNTDVDDLPF